MRFKSACLIVFGMSLSACGDNSKYCPLELQIFVDESGDNKSLAKFDFELKNVGSESIEISTDRLPWNDPSKLNLSLSMDLARHVEVMDPVFSTGLPEIIRLSPGGDVSGGLPVLAILKNYEKTRGSVVGSAWTYDFRMTDVACRVSGALQAASNLHEAQVAASCPMVLGVPPGCTAIPVEVRQLAEARAYLARHGESFEGLIPIQAERCADSMTLVLSDCATTRPPRMVMIELDRDGQATAMSLGR